MFLSVKLKTATAALDQITWSIRTKWSLKFCVEPYVQSKYVVCLIGIDIQF